MKIFKTPKEHNVIFKGEQASRLFLFFCELRESLFFTANSTLRKRASLIPHTKRGVYGKSDTLVAFDMHRLRAKTNFRHKMFCVRNNIFPHIASEAIRWSKKNVPATEDAGALTITYELIHQKNHLRRRRDATSASAPTPANNPNAEGSGTIDVAIFLASSALTYEV